jgi:ATP-binding cassette subfamily F protein 3
MGIIRSSSCSAGRLAHYSGGYQYYLDKTRAASARAALTAGAGGASSTSPTNSGRRGTPPSDGASRKEQRRREAEERQARSRERKAQQQIVHQLERQSQDLERRQTEITAELEKPETYQASGRAMELNREFRFNADELAGLIPQWEQAATRLAALDSA